MFEVGQVWRMRDGKVVTIARVAYEEENRFCYCILFKGFFNALSYTKDGFLWFQNEPNQWDLVELIEATPKNTQERVIKWAKKVGIDAPENVQKQLLKTVEEFGELVNAVFKGDGVKEELGDVLVCLTIVANSLGLTFEDCLQCAVTKLESRTGKTVNGLFIKDEDLSDEKI
jgi:NTP pyrophosphatase (non-canonical NTP hydrolase)